MQLLKALPRKKLGKAPFCLTLGLFRTALNAVIWDTLLVIQRPQVFLLSFLSVDILLSISPGLMQSRAHAAEFVPTINKICLCHTEVFGGSNWLIDLFAVEQAYFIYAECLHLSFPKKKEGKKQGIVREGVAENLTGILADSQSAMRKEGWVPQGPGEA